ncbi:MAG: acyltransferase family protein [Crocinitomicaceae bacterium]
MGILRTLLALSVVLAHSSSLFGIELVGGQLAVQSFYMISGFYMTMVLNEKYVAANSSYKLFITNRILRLLPVYWVVLVLAVLLSLIIFFDDNSSILTPFHMFQEFGNVMSIPSIIFIIIANLITLFQDWIVFLGLNLSTGGLFFTSSFLDTNPLLYKFLFIPQAWTIGVEITFYLIAPFIVRRKLKLIIVLIISSVLLRILLMQNGFNHDPWTYRFFPTELVFFLLGTIAFHLYKKVSKQKISKNILIGIYCFVFLSTFIYSRIDMEYKMICYLVIFLCSMPFVFLLSKNWKIDRYIGELSYPIYISHMLVSTFITYFKVPLYGGKTFILVLITIILSVILNELVAKKVEVIRQKRIK